MGERDPDSTHEPFPSGSADISQTTPFKRFVSSMANALRVEESGPPAANLSDTTLVENDKSKPKVRSDLGTRLTGYSPRDPEIRALRRLMK